LEKQYKKILKTNTQHILNFFRMGPNCQKLLFKDQLIKLNTNKINIKIIRLNKDNKIKNS
jgi:hypothetical protein